VKYNQTIYPEELAAYLLHNVKKRAILVSGTSINDFVITVPTYFTQSQRIAVLDAAKIADLNVVALVESNIASAFWYGAEKSRTMPINASSMRNINKREAEKSGISQSKESSSSKAPRSQSFFSRFKNFFFKQKQVEKTKATSKWDSFKVKSTPLTTVYHTGLPESPLVDIRHIIFVDVGANQVSFTLAEYRFLIEETDTNSSEGFIGCKCIFF
jgi:hypothetical protein